MQPYDNYQQQSDSRSHIPIVLAVTPPFACVFFKGLIRPLIAAGFRPTLVSAPGDQLRRIADTEGAKCEAIPMEREISPWRDLLALWRIYRLIRRVKPELADVGTPKAGLLGGLAALLAGVPSRVYTLRGLRLETTNGWKRRLLMVTERIACACANKVICVSPSLRERAVDLKLVDRGKTVVLANGSCGIDVARFAPIPRDSAPPKALAERLRIPHGAPVIGFVGRLTRDKGIHELVAAYLKLRRKHPNLHLLLVGDFEDGDPVPRTTRNLIETDHRIMRTGFVPDAAPYYPLMDVFVFPTHREGFGEVSLEAQASGVPVVTTRATGAVDTVLDNVSGFLTPVGDTETLADRIAMLLEDDGLRNRMGKAGRSRVVREYSLDIVAQALVHEYTSMSRTRRTVGSDRLHRLEGLQFRR